MQDATSLGLTERELRAIEGAALAAHFGRHNEAEAIRWAAGYHSLRERKDADRVV